MPDISVDISFFRIYSEARRQFLRGLGCADSCRDPLSEFAERLVNQQLGGELATSRVQKGYDLVTSDGRRVQVKYLANASRNWRNGHTVAFSGEMDDYAVVFFEDLDVRAIIVFRRETLAQVCAALKKKHPDQDRVLQLGQGDFKRIIGNPDAFEAYGVTCYLPIAKSVHLPAATIAHR